MTTIAACAIEGVMCSDSGWNDGDTRGEARKVFRVRGDLVGFAGVLPDIQAFLADYRKKKEPPAKLAVVALRLNKAGHIHAWSHGEWCAMQEKQFAIGTGGTAARAAMKHGATAREAVKTAISLDAGSFGPVRTYRI